MKKLAIIFAVGMAAMLGASASNASDNTAKAKASTEVTQSTDIGSRERHGRHHGRNNHQSRHGHGSYGYAPRTHHSAGGPAVSIGIGGGGRHGGHGQHNRGW